MTATNDITGDKIQSRVLSKQGRDNWDRVFGKKTSKPESQSTKGDNDAAEKRLQQKVSVC